MKLAALDRLWPHLVFFSFPNDSSFQDIAIRDINQENNCDINNISGDIRGLAPAKKTHTLQGMKILFITSTHLGDGILSTGGLDHLIKAYPAAEITVACGPVTAGIFAKAPGVVRVIPMKKEPYAGHWRKLASETLGQTGILWLICRNSRCRACCV